MPTVAEQLRSTREGHGWTIHQVAEATKIKTEHIRALEAGEYGAFAAPVYIRGFIRTYARLLRLDPEEVSNAVDSELSQTNTFQEASLSAPRNRGLVDFLMLQFSKVSWRVVLPVLAVAIVLVGIILGYRAYTSYRTRDPLAPLGPGLHEPARLDPIETLPLPTGGRP
jgi:cytoskeletal protein RodZ